MSYLGGGKQFNYKPRVQDPGYDDHLILRSGEKKYNILI